MKTFKQILSESIQYKIGSDIVFDYKFKDIPIVFKELSGVIEKIYKNEYTEDVMDIKLHPYSVSRTRYKRIRKFNPMFDKVRVWNNTTKKWE